MDIKVSWSFAVTLFPQQWDVRVYKNYVTKHNATLSYSFDTIITSPVTFSSKQIHFANFIVVKI